MASCILHADDTGRSLTVKPGQKILIRLEENPTTGYLWNVIRPENDRLLRFEGFEYMDENVETRQANEVMFGRGRVKQFTFVSRKEGQEDISLRLKQPWERDSDQDQVFRVRVQIETD
jgi:inhibitor of cysteine peptidase